MRRFRSEELHKRHDRSAGSKTSNWIIILAMGVIANEPKLTEAEAA
jgi:hypothetical protein